MRAAKGLSWIAVIAATFEAPLRTWSQPPEPRETAPPGLVIVIGGIGGLDLLGVCAQSALPRAGLKHEVREFVWTHGWGQLFKDLTNHDHLRKKADELALIIRRLKAENPDRPIYIVAKSGGTGLALLTAELLPEDTLERIVLLAAAVSPDYDLRRAFRATRREIVSFHSSYDVFILNWGTRQFGTIDRVYGPSAGLNGFRVPADLDADGRNLYSRLVQVPWHSRMILQGHSGGHAASSFPPFIAAEVAPWLR